MTFSCPAKQVWTIFLNFKKELLLNLIYYAQKVYYIPPGMFKSTCVIKVEGEIFSLDVPHEFHVVHQLPDVVLGAPDEGHPVAEQSRRKH
jgi:hypothetical protein